MKCAGGGTSRRVYAQTDAREASKDIEVYARILDFRNRRPDGQSIGEAVHRR
jgi:hypothetical protein